MKTRTTEELKRETAARNDAARSMLRAAALTVDETDEHCWLVRDYRFWPVSGFWKRPDGSPGGGGLIAMIAAIKAARAGAVPQ